MRVSVASGSTWGKVFTAPAAQADCCRTPWPRAAEVPKGKEEWWPPFISPEVLSTGGGREAATGGRPTHGGGRRLLLRVEVAEEFGLIRQDAGQDLAGHPEQLRHARAGQ